VNHRPAANNDFFFTKVFGDGEYIAAGQLRIPPKMNKPSKMTKDNTYVRLLSSFLVTWLMGKFRQTGVLCNRRCCHVQGSRIIVYPLHGRYDPGSARKHILHREHGGSRCQVVLRSGAARVCGRRGPTRGATRFRSRTHDCTTATLKQPRSGARDRPPFQ
jgi:hypothetical protein